MLPEHKNPIFVSKRPKISKNSPILTQNPDFVLERPENGGPEAKKRTKMPILCSAEHGTSTERPSAARNNHPKRNKTAWDEAQRPEAQRYATATQRTQHNETEAQGNATHATQLHNGEQQKRRQPFGLSPLKIGGYLLSHMVVQYHRRK